MSTNYSLAVTNNSSQLQDIVVFQKAPDRGRHNVLSLAWLTKRAHSGATVTFNWSEDYNFVWSESGPLRPGVTFKAQQAVPADPDRPVNNQIQFGYPSEAYTFVDGPAVRHPRPGSIYIRTLSDVPNGGAWVGIGMSGAGTFVVPATPNMVYDFTPHPEYWVAAGTFTAGEVMDIEEITNAHKVTYESTLTHSLVLHADNLMRAA
ncbi:hypothetical protein [Actinophytocola oryzae]|uniref:Protein RhiA n=1 Tax=Actinophytocola oryzae TaxID=502181 RepID=A0A4V3FUR9_9PSEU|nr:hypothetical protein [Actinophytocola oryzae]TDV56291.1 hypothetical protein CLV71_102357 [Actinophytocola oryzae]